LPIVEGCGNSSAGVLCVNHYAAVLPYHFYRNPAVNSTHESTFASTVVGNDASFKEVANATFLVFDKEKGLKVLGDTPSYKFMFNGPSI
jgi:hypothetical protein